MTDPIHDTPEAGMIREMPQAGGGEPAQAATTIDVATDAPPAAPAADMLLEPAGAGTPPDRLANNPASPHYDEAVLARGIGIRFKGIERNNVDEYCISENWVRVSVAGSRDRHGQPITIKQTGPVEAYFRTGG